MKQCCLTCRREAPPGRLWCQELSCATDDKPLILEPGEPLADMEILRPVAILPTATVYAAERSGRPILLKVAHQGHEARLQREVQLLARLVQPKGALHPVLPALLPAHAQADVKRFPFDQVVADGISFTYTVFAYVPGEPLSAWLLQEPQPWYQHAGWIVLSVADALVWLHRQQYLHLALSPDSILVRRDREGIPRPLLLDLGAVSPPAEAGRTWQPALAYPSYAAPELLARLNGRHGQEGSPIGAEADVYGLGLLLYELLAGQPAYPARLRPANDIYRDVLHTPPRLVTRPDLRQLPELALQAISKEPRRRPPHIVAFARELQATLPAVPREKLPRTVNWRLVAVVLATAMTIALLLALAATLAG